MEASSIWWLCVLALLMLELLSGTFYLLMLALGAVAAALAAHLGAGLPTQLALAAVVGAGAAGVLYFLRTRKAREPAGDLNLDLGQVLLVEHWGPEHESRIRYRGADWVVTLAPDQPISASGRYRVVAIEGSRLVLAPV